MAEKPTTAKEYSSDQSKLVRATCLYVATILGDYMEDIVIVGGLVPSLLAPYQFFNGDAAINFLYAKRGSIYRPE